MLWVIRQANMDYALAHAIKWFDGTYYHVVFYDVVCQYWKKLVFRLRSGQYLGLDPDKILRYALGQWHVHGHQRQCYYKFAPIFIPGAGWVDGEIIETVWPPLNDAAASNKGMGNGHRQESLDFLMGDWNWKKVVGMRTFACFVLSPLRRV